MDTKPQNWLQVNEMLRMGALSGLLPEDHRKLQLSGDEFPAADVRVVLALDAAHGPRHGLAVLDKPKGQGVMGKSCGRSRTRGCGFAALRWAHLANAFGANQLPAEPSP
jgi:hypothetical protein